MPVGLGAYGIVVRLTLDVQPTYSIRQDVYVGLSWRTVLDDFDGVLGAGYSVSFFTPNWADESVPMTFVKRRREIDGVPDDWMGARRAERQLSIFDAPDPNITAQGRLEPWFEGLPHVRVDSTPSTGSDIQSESFVARGDAAAAIEAIQAVAPRFVSILQMSEIRTVAADQLWLSEAYGRDTVAFLFTWRDDKDAVAQAVDVVEEAIPPFNARPHWGKVHHFDKANLARAYPRLGVVSGEVGQSGDWWFASEGGVGSVVIVEVQPGR